MFFQDFYHFLFGKQTLHEILSTLLIISLLYAIMMSKTTIGYLIRGFLAIVVFTSLYTYVHNGEILYGIKVAMIQGTIYFLPYIVKYIFILITVFIAVFIKRNS